MWSLLEIALKLAIYLSIISIIGAMAARTLTHVVSYNNWLGGLIIVTATLGLIASIVQFFVAVGSFNEEGISGIFDTQISLLLWQSPVGDSVLVRCVGFILIILSCIPLLRSPLRAGLWVCAVVILAYSFTLIGHTSELAWFTRLAIILHVLALSLWAGTLIPLIKMLGCMSPQQCHQAMTRYGHIATFVIALLLLTGIFLVTQLVVLEQGLTHNYNLLLLVKIFLVIAMLLLGVRNKILLVPQLVTNPNTAVVMLTRAIKGEAVLVVGVLILSAIFTTVLGPS